MARLFAALVQLADLTTRVKLPKGRKLSFREDFNEAGFVTVTLDNDDPGVGSVVFPNTLLNYYIDDTLAFTGLLERFEAVDLGKDEEADEETTYEGRGHLALLDRIVVYPGLGVGKRPKEQQRSFNYTANAYDDSGWPFATEIDTVGDAKLNWPNVAGGGTFAEDFPDDTASVIGPSSGTVTTAPTGIVPFRGAVTISANGTYRLFAVIDNYGEIYADGVLVLSPGQAEDGLGFTRAAYIDLEFTAGPHVISGYARNLALPPDNTDDPIGVAIAAYPVDPAGNIGALFEFHTDTTWKVLEYPPELPGMTPGQALLLLLGEAQARVYDDELAIAALLTCSFDEVNDTNGDPWPVYADMATKVGTTFFTFLRELSATYIDFYMAPGTLVLDAFIKGGRGESPDVTFETDVNLTRIERTGEV